MSKLSWTLLLVASMAGIAAQYSILKLLDGVVDPYLLAFSRFFVASCALLPVVIHQRLLRLPPIHEWPFFIMLACFAVVPTIFIVMGVAQAGSIVSAILINTNPLLVALIAPFLIGEHMNGKKAAALGVGFLGVIAIVVNGQQIGTIVTSGHFVGSLLLMAGALLSALNAIYSKGLVRKYNGLYVVFFSVIIGTTILAFVVALQGGFSEVAHLAPSTFLWLIVIGVVGTAIPWTAWSSSLKHLEANVAVSFKLLIPVFAAFYSFIFFTEAFTVWMLLGLLLTSGGIYLVQREDARPVVVQ